MTDTDSEKNLEEEVKECKEISLFARVQVLLEFRGLSQAELAGKLGVSRQYLNGVLHERMKAPVKFKVKLARELGVDSSVIWKLDEEGA